jgi:hypothetical protein
MEGRPVSAVPKLQLVASGSVSRSADWSRVRTVGGHTVYDVTPSRQPVQGKRLTFGKRSWFNPESYAADRQEVEVYIPAGGASGLNKAAIVRLPDGRTEVWTRED